MRERGRVVALLSVLVLLATSGCTADGEPAPSTTVTETTTPSGSQQITLAVYGAPAVVNAYTALASAFSAERPDVTVSVRPYRTREEAMTALEELPEDRRPDLFLAGEADIPALVADERIQPVDQMLVERQVDFGDGYVRAGLEALSADSRLQCMPVEVSPMVVYYNADLVRMSRLAVTGEAPPTSVDGWTLDQFARAARRAYGESTRGAYVGADLGQLAPFLLSTGSNLVDDPAEPTTLTMADDADAVVPVLDLLRDRRATFSARQLQSRSALARFKAGELAMIVGERGLTPELRQQQDLRFGVMPIPRGVRRATTARVDGMCVSSAIEDTGAVGDVLAEMTGQDAGEALAATGYVVPANAQALRSASFSQIGQTPPGAAAYSGQMRYLRPLPTAATWQRVVEGTAPEFQALLDDPVIDPLETRLTRIDEISQEILAEEQPEE